MECEVEYCIYNINLECLYDETRINEYGICDICIIVDIDKEYLEKEKTRQRLKMESL